MWLSLHPPQRIRRCSASRRAAATHAAVVSVSAASDRALQRPSRAASHPPQRSLRIRCIGSGIATPMSTKQSTVSAESLRIRCIGSGDVTGKTDKLPIDPQTSPYPLLRIRRCNPSTSEGGAATNDASPYPLLRIRRCNPTPRPLQVVVAGIVKHYRTRWPPVLRRKSVFALAVGAFAHASGRAWRRAPGCAHRDMAAGSCSRQSRSRR